jgi:hypothetical protein
LHSLLGLQEQPQIQIEPRYKGRDSGVGFMRLLAHFFAHAKPPQKQHSGPAALARLTNRHRYGTPLPTKLDLCRCRPHSKIIFRSFMVSSRHGRSRDGRPLAVSSLQMPEK